MVFSRWRPLQLHGYLTSLYAHVADTESISVTVLAKIDPPYVQAYAEVGAAFPQVRIVPEVEFAVDLPVALGDAEYTCFGCDDVVFVRSIDGFDLDGLFGQQPIIGLSLRLGINVNRGMFGEPMPQPRFDGAAGGLLWDVTKFSADWAYPWEVLGTIYQTEFARRMVDSLGARNPSQLEALGAQTWPNMTDRRLMAAYPSARIVVPTVNVVQTEYPGNGILGSSVLTPQFLLDCWNSGLRLDTERFAQRQFDSWRIPDFYLRRAA